MGMRIRPALGAVILLGVSIGVALVVAEVGLRLIGYRGEPISRISNIYPVDDPVLDWRYVPNSEVRSGQVVYRYNAAGFRDMDHSVEKPSGVERILVLGDSVTEGYGVEWADVFARVLQSRLGQRHEVINIAAGGLNTPQEIHLLERVGAQYRPDLVVVNFVMNDVDFYTRYGAAQRAAEEGDSRIASLNIRIPPQVKRLLKSSAAIYLAKERVQSLRETLFGGDRGGYYDMLWASDQNRRKVTDGFAKLAELRRRHRFDVLVIIWPLITDYRSYRFDSIHAWVAGEATKMNFSVIDLFAPFSSRPYRTLQVSAEDSVHPNALGHRLGVEAFLAWYRSRDQTPRTGAARLGAGGR
jgi:lysophospholipase L1-like esterase